MHYSWFTKQDISDYPPTLSEINDLSESVARWSQIYFFSRLFALVASYLFALMLFGIETWADVGKLLCLGTLLYLPFVIYLPRLISYFIPVSCSINDEEFVFPTLKCTFETVATESFAHFSGEAARYVRNTNGRQLYQLDYDICLYLNHSAYDSKGS